VIEQREEGGGHAKIFGWLM